MIKMTQSQKELLENHMDNFNEIAEKGELRCLLTAIEETIIAKGIDVYNELTDLGLELQAVYDKIVAENDYEAK